MSSDWFVSPEGLSRARLQQLLTQEQLSKKSGSSVRSIRGYERKEQRVQIDTLQCLATALSVEVREIATLRAKERVAKKPARTPDAPSATPSTLPPRTPLETLVDLERAAGIDAVTVPSARGPVETLTAKRLQDVFTAYALHEGARFSLTGRVENMRALAVAEATLVGSRGGVAARFHIVKEIVPGQPVGVTVHTARKEDTAKLQKHYAKPVTLFLRVVIVPGEPRDDGPGFSAFITRITTKRPWTFVVEEVAVAAEATKEAKKAKKGEEGKSAAKRPARARRRAS